MTAAPDPRRWRRFAKVALFVLVAITSIPFVLVSLFASAGGRRA